MRTQAVRLYGKEDLRLEEFTLPDIKEDEILASVITDSLCMSSWKLAKQGEEHKKAPTDLAENPIIIGHEFCGQIIKVGSKWKSEFSVGDKYVVQANLQLPNRPDCPGYSYCYTGGDATYIILSKDIMEQNCLIHYNGESFFEGALIEPLSCVISAFEANYHLIKGTNQHEMGIKGGGNLLIMGGTGPMGMLAIDYALHGPIKPKHIVVTDLDESKLERTKKLYPSQDGITVTYVNVQDMTDQIAVLRDVVEGGYDDIFVMIALKSVVEEASQLLNADGCLNLFAGPQDKSFSGNINLYDLHYAFTHYVGTSGGNIEDMRKAVALIEEKKVNVANVITHILGLNAVADATLHQPEIGGGKKLVYTNKQCDLTTISDIDETSALGQILKKTNYIWSKEAEQYIIENFKDISDIM
jgi:L-sorbose 1-phosphate reductase (EC 1.1.1.-)